MVFVFKKVFTNTIFYQILVFGDTNISIKIIFGLFLFVERFCVQNYNFFLTFHSQFVQIDSQFVQIYRISSQIAVFRHFCVKTGHQ